ncbi:acyltransferase family protein [Micromonospora sp. WMMA1923]|uniref:acyltransferase family protein n=1 Tax=Micromonospora sp. WMMA1923 TaxID=3404125 RepID=UPI003B93673C
MAWRTAPTATRPGVRGQGDSRVGFPVGFRADIEGLRAVAVLLVLVGHAAPAVLPGGYVGVDVFFVISGFLITGLLAEELDRTGRISLTAFYARRARRLLPAAGLVLLASLLLALLFLPRVRWASTGWDVVASALYVMNWRLAERAVDYLAVGQADSLLQHYWSLAVEEQFYLLWPLLMIVVATGFGRRRAARVAGSAGLSGLLLLGVAAVGIPSFVWSVLSTASDPERAYFVTTTRLWELALGAVVAVLGLRWGRLPSALGATLAWLGLGAIGVAAVLFGADTRFPGALALLPTLGAAAVIVGGLRPGRAGPGRLLGLRPMRAVGALSYSLYLWHWPLLVAAGAYFGELATPAAIGVVAFAVLPAVLTHRYLEQPVRRAPLFTYHPGAALQLGATCTGFALVAGLLFQFTVWPPAPRPGALVLPPLDASSAAPGRSTPAVPLTGAAVLAQDPRDDPKGAPVDRVPTITPDPTVAYQDVADVYRQDCISPGDDATVLECVYGDRDAEYVVALAGDSQAAQWVPAMQAVAEANGWRLVTYLKTGCPYQEMPIPVGRGDALYRTCVEWNDRLRPRLTASAKPDLLVLSNVTYRPFEDGRLVPGEEGLARSVRAMKATWSQAVRAGVPVVLIRDIPYQDMDVSECVSRHPERLTTCTTARREALEPGEAQARAAGQASGVRLVDLTDAICPTQRCAPVIGGVLVYRDTSHLTATYVQTLAPRLRDALERVAS